jgi:DNA polymerase-3 subunit alpha
MPDFVHLHNHSDFSLLDGAASVKSMVDKAKSLGMPGLALTDHGNMFGAVKFFDTCKEAGINPIVGSEFYVAGGSRFEKTGTENGNKYWHLVLLAQDVEGFRNLLKLSSASYTEGFYYKPRIDDELLARHSKGLIASSACLAGEVPGLVRHGKVEEAERKALWFKELFGPQRYYLELQDHGIPDQASVNKVLVGMSKKLGIPLIATNDMHYLDRTDADAHDVLLCIGTNKKLSEATRMRFSGREFYMKTADEMAAVFGELPEALSNTLRINEMVDLDIPYPGPLLPDYVIPEGFASPEDYLRHLTFEGLGKRYASVGDEIHKRAEYELDVITGMKFTGYFLIVWDFIDWAKRHGIPVGPGRGSGAGSIVAYALAITDIDPLRYGLLFERFLNPERISMPDFDIDFCFERRSEVIDYVTGKYGADRVGQIITFGTLKAKAALKDVARVLEIGFDESNAIAKLVPEDIKMTLDKALALEPKLAEMAASTRLSSLFTLARKLENKNRNSSLHAAGIVIAKTALSDYVPLYRDAKSGIVATQYTMEALEKCGLVKMDFLGLKTLTLIKNAIGLIRKLGIEIDESAIPDTDPKTYALLGQGKSTSVFQFESSGMQGILKDAKPTCIEDLIALNALYRPGPMAYIPQFIDSKWGRKPIKYPHPCLEPILKETYGVIVYQEQVMQVAQRIAGYSLGQADLLRRAMSKKKADVMLEEKVKFVEGAINNGFKESDAASIFDILIPFAGYGFNKSHAAAYSVVAYRTAWLKANYPAEFMAANLSNEITKTDKLSEYISEARSMGLEIMPPNVNFSEAYFTVVEGKIVYGLLGIKGVGEGVSRAIVAERESRGPFAELLDFISRMSSGQMNRKTLECLANAGALDWTGRPRSELVANIERAIDYVAKKEEAGRYGQVSLFEASGEQEFPPFQYEARDEYPRPDLLRLEKELIGFYFSGHPMDEWRDLWERSSDAPLAHPDRASPERSYTLVAMLKNYREILSKKGRKMAFCGVEDYSGSIEIVVFPDVLEKYRERFLLDKVLFMKGKIDLSRNAPSFKVEELLDPQALAAKSWREVHLRLAPGIRAEDELFDLRDAVFDSHGSCHLFFHIPREAPVVAAPSGEAEEGQLDCETDEDGIPLPAPIEACADEARAGDGGAADEEVAGDRDLRPRGGTLSRVALVLDETIVRASMQITCSPSEESLERFRLLSVVTEVWRD